MRASEQQTGAAAPRAVARPSTQRRLRAQEAPVFHDATGRRRRVVTVLGVLAASLTALWLCAMVVGATGFATLPSIRRVLAVHRAPGGSHVRRVVAASAPVSRATLVRSARAVTRRRAVTVLSSHRAVMVDLQ